MRIWAPIAALLVGICAGSPAHAVSSEAILAKRQEELDAAASDAAPEHGSDGDDEHGGH